MATDRCPAATNVVRFPIERRAPPTLDLMRELAPDGRDVLEVVAAYGLADLTATFRERATAEMADYLCKRNVADPCVLLAALREVLTPMIAEAIAVCWSARDMADATVAARQALALAQTTGEGWLSPLRARVETLKRERAKLLIAAHARVEEAEGVARAVDLARRGEPWVPAASTADPAGTAMPGSGTATPWPARANSGRAGAGVVAPKGAA